MIWFWYPNWELFVLSIPVVWLLIIVNNVTGHTDQDHGQVQLLGCCYLWPVPGGWHTGVRCQMMITAPQPHLTFLPIMSYTWSVTDCSYLGPGWKSLIHFYNRFVSFNCHRGAFVFGYNFENVIHWFLMMMIMMICWLYHWNQPTGSCHGKLVCLWSGPSLCESGSWIAY